MLIYRLVFINHRSSIHHQQPALPLENEHVLVLGLLVVEDLLNTNAEAVSLPKRGTQLREPALLKRVHSLKAKTRTSMLAMQWCTRRQQMVYDVMYRKIT